MRPFVTLQLAVFNRIMHGILAFLLINGICGGVYLFV